MFSLFLILLVVFAVLSLLLAAWTLFFQGYIYSEPVEAIYWRAPAASAALTLFLLLWMVLDYRSIETPKDEGRYRPLHDFSGRETETFDKLAIIGQDRKTVQYNWNGKDYRSKNGRPLRERPLKIIATDKDGQEHVFMPATDANGNFKVEKEQALRYYEKDNPNRYMEETSLGQISTYHYGWLVVELLLHLGFLGVWFLSMWLLLRFQWPHALGLAFVATLISVFILPMVLTPAENVRKERLTPAQTALSQRPLSILNGYSRKRGNAAMGVETITKRCSS
ncbi:MAG: hypothetical protein ACYC3I_13875 [Gemmataceae bacterium]